MSDIHDLVLVEEGGVVDELLECLPVLEHESDLQSRIVVRNSPNKGIRIIAARTVGIRIRNEVNKRGLAASAAASDGDETFIQFQVERGN